MAGGAADALAEARSDKEKIYQRLKEARELARETPDPAERLRQANRAKILRDMYRDACDRVERLRPAADRRRRTPARQRLTTGGVTWDLFERTKSAWADLEGTAWTALGRLQEEADAYGGQVLLALLQRGQEALTERQRYYIGQCFGAGKSMAQAAQEAGVRRSTVLRCVRAGLRRLEVSVIGGLYALQCVEGDAFDHLRWAEGSEVLTERQRECLYYLLTDDASLAMIADSLGRHKSCLSRMSERISGRLAGVDPALPGKRPRRVVHRAEWRGRGEDEIAEALGIAPGTYYRQICRDRPVGGVPRLAYEILLRDRQGREAADIARELDMTPATVRRYLRRYADVDPAALPAPRPYRPRQIRRREDLDLRRLLTGVGRSGGEGTIGAAISADTYYQMMAASAAR